MRRFTQLFALMLMVLLAAGADAADRTSGGARQTTAAQRTKPTQEDRQLFDKATASWKNSSFTDHLHQQKGVGCVDCHGKSRPVKGDAADNATCSKCHGDYPALAARSKLPAKLANRNPHASHLGDIDCVVCHKAHTVSAPYCLGCHTNFDMRIPGGK